jgi:ABC-2 type transport system permease protein
MAPALATESRKAVASVVVRSATVLLVVGISALSVAMSLAVDSGNEQLRAKLGPIADEDGWSRLTGLESMISAPAGLLGFGVVLSWMVGREFAEGTVSGLFALPVSRRDLAAAKLIVFWIWTVAVAMILAISCTLLGLVLGYGVPAGEDASRLLRLLAVVVLTGLLALPAGWAATLGRGLLPGVATTIVLITLGQILVVANTGAWFPVAAPALWAVSPAEVTRLQLALVPFTSVLVAGLTTRTWHRLQLDH